jgi:FtsP/CotA-like multicopper oxidase with cupredoxin domain
MDVTRRRLLQAGAVAGGSLLVPANWTRSAVALARAGVTRFTEPLPTLAELGVLDMRGGGSASLTMVNGTHRFHSALGAADTFCYQDPKQPSQEYLGPVIVAKQGQGFDLTVSNDLGAHPLAFAVETNLHGVVDADKRTPRAATHLHGGNTDVRSDGGPEDTFLPGSSWVYHYGNTQEAAGLWYHDHALGITRLNVYAGLAGGYLIRNDDDLGDGTKLPAPPYEVPLILQDRMFNGDGTLAYPPNPAPTHPAPLWAPEFFGDVATVNGKAWPVLDVARGKYRFRVYNGSNARVYDLKIVDSAGRALAFAQIGTDGGLLDAPVRMTRLVLAPGERADLVVDFAGLAAGTRLTMTNKAPTPFPDGPRSVKLGAVPLRQIMQFVVTGETGFTAPLPTSLRTTPITRLGNAGYTGSAFPLAATRTMTLVEIMDPVVGPLMALLNNRSFHDTDFRRTPVASNTLELWELVNLTGDAHPIHLHFTQFQVLNRQRFDAGGYQSATYGPGMLMEGDGPYPPPPVGRFLRGGTKPPAANERGWKDTVVAMPGEVTRILVPFGPTAAGAGRPLAIGAAHTGEYVWHCHILEHEDNDMMQRYLIT